MQGLLTFSWMTVEDSWEIQCLGIKRQVPAPGPAAAFPVTASVNDPAPVPAPAPAPAPEF